MTRESSSKTTHIERTAKIWREQNVHAVQVRRIEEVNDRKVRIIQLGITDEERGIQFSPGQWLDVFLPGLPKPGGFTITSTPRNASPSRTNGELRTTQPEPYLELAVQKTSNPPAQYLWQHPTELIGLQFLVRVGGDFTYPPPAVGEESAVPEERIKRLVLVAGGVGINPLISILTHLHETDLLPPRTVVLYGTKGTKREDGSNILFLERLRKIAAQRATEGKPVVELRLFVTPSATADAEGAREGAQSGETYHTRRMSREDILSALGPTADREGTVIYVCGPRGMTDEFIELCQNAEGMKAGGRGRVRCERWW